MLMKTVAIVGGGLGGLSAAITLASSGFHVKLFEKNSHFGGKMMAVTLEDYQFDFGSNTITMPHVYQDVLKQAGLEPGHYFTFEQITTHTRNTYSDGLSFDLSSSQSYMIDQLKRLDPKGASKYKSFIKEVEKLYKLSNQYFFNRTIESWKDFLSPQLGNALRKVKPNRTIHELFAQYFQNPRIIQALDRYATYIGSNPYSAPASFAMNAYLELVDGVYFAKGGNTNIAEGFVEAARYLGVELYANTKVKQINIVEQHAKGVTLENDDTINADEVIINGDLLKAYPELVPEEHRPHFTNQKVREYAPSHSGFIILAGLEGRISDLYHDHHFFSGNYKKEFRQIESGDYATEPTIHIRTSSKMDPNVSPSGDNCFILVNAPPTPINSEENFAPDHYKNIIYDRLESFGIDIRSQLKVEQVWTPTDIREKFGAFRGSIYGPASNKKISTFMRPFNRSQDISNIYFAGGTTHPGGGSPMVVLSGKNVAESIIRKHRK